MRPLSFRLVGRVSGLLILCCWAALKLKSQSAPAPANAFTSEAQIQVTRAAQEVSKIKSLVDEGTLPRSQLEGAEKNLADAQDELILAETLYGKVHVQDLTDEEGAAMIAAAQRRLDREQELLDQRRKLLSSGILARADLNGVEEELASRRRVLELTQNRVKLLNELKSMAEAEHAAQANSLALKSVMIRYDGNGRFDLSDLPLIRRDYQAKFGLPLPVSALGQTAVHQAMGLDHRNRVDVALSPDSAKGLWLLELLEQLHIPYLAFRSAIAGAATAPHIHIGTGSSRLAVGHR